MPARCELSFRYVRQVRQRDRVAPEWSPEYLEQHGPRILAIYTLWISGYRKTKVALLVRN